VRPILNLKREKPYWGARKIANACCVAFSCEVKVPARSTIHAVLDRHGWSNAEGADAIMLRGTPCLWGKTPMSYGAPTTKASSCWATKNTVTR